MHPDKVLAGLQRSVLLEALTINLTPREAENLFATQRCAATSIATINSKSNRYPLSIHSHPIAALK